MPEQFAPKKYDMNLETLKFPIGHFSKPDFITENDIQNWIETIEMFPSKLKNAGINLSI